MQSTALHHLHKLFLNIGNRLTKCTKQKSISAIPIPKCHNPTPLWAQPAKNSTMPVMHSKMKSIDNKTVTRLFLPSPLFIQPLYHPQWVLMCITIKTTNARLTHMWKFAHGRHPPCQETWRTTCSLMPENTVKANVRSRHQSITNILFILSPPPVPS